jgi:hypothetical protein
MEAAEMRAGGAYAHALLAVDAMGEEGGTSVYARPRHNDGGAGP